MHHWAIAESYLPQIEAIVRLQREAPEKIPAMIAAAGTRKREPQRSPIDGIHIMELVGAIEQKPSYMSAAIGEATSTIGFGRELTAAVNNPNIDTILVEIDSPGGTVPGVQELADVVYEARQKKPIIGLINSMCASAAYWIGSQMSQLILTPGGVAGSVGVFCGHISLSGALDKAGIVVTLVKRPEKKAELNPYYPLSDDARDTLQAGVDRTYRAFIAAVARGRKTTTANVDGRYGRGSVLDSDEALRVGMVDKIEATDSYFGNFIAKRQRAAQQRAVVRAERAVENAELELRITKAKRAGAVAIGFCEQDVAAAEGALVQARREASDAYLHGEHLSPEMQRLRLEHERQKREALRYSK